MILKARIMLLEGATPVEIFPESEAMHIRILPHRVVKKLYLPANACHCCEMPSMAILTNLFREANLQTYRGLAGSSQTTENTLSHT
jgi:hypothetical protein